MAADTLEESAFEESAFGASAYRARGLRAADVGSVYEAHIPVRLALSGAASVSATTALDDALQDVFVVVHDKLHHFDGKANLRTWIYSIALRVARRYRERIAKDARKFVSSTERAAATTRVKSSTRCRGGRVISSASSIPPSSSTSPGVPSRLLDDEKREAFVLAYVEQMSAPEIAEITGLPLNTVYSRVRAARLAFTARVARMQSLARRSPR